MLKVLLLLSLLSLTAAEETKVTVDWFLGKWLPVAIYPEKSGVPVCDWMELKSYPRYKCSCDGSNVAPVFVIWRNPLGVMPALAINSLTELEAALALNCQCQEKHEIQAVYRRINDNFIVIYSKSTGTPDYAMLLAKSSPKYSELQAVMKSIEDLKDRVPAILCDLSGLTSESSDAN